jgi:hypothetical protein
MTGAEHYRKAEEMLDAALRAGLAEDEEHYALGAALAHATLALAQATRLQGGHLEYGES